MKYLARSRFSFWSILVFLFCLPLFFPFSCHSRFLFLFGDDSVGETVVVVLSSLLFSLYESLFSDLAIFTAANYFFVARK